MRIMNITDVVNNYRIDNSGTESSGGTISKGFDGYFVKPNFENFGNLFIGDFFCRTNTLLDKNKIDLVVSLFGTKKESLIIVPLNREEIRCMVPLSFKKRSYFDKGYADKHEKF